MVEKGSFLWIGKRGNHTIISELQLSFLFATGINLSDGHEGMETREAVMMKKTMKMTGYVPP